MTAGYFDGLGEICLDTFGDQVPAVYQSQIEDAQPVELMVIYNARHQDVDYNDIPYGAPHPVAWFRTGLISPVYGDTITIKDNGVDITYIINDEKDDGLELTQLGLTAP